jgi:hypothetical protein
MIKKIHGPTYKYQGECLDSPTIIWIQDHCYDEDSQSYALNDLLNNSVCDPTLHTLVFDHVNQQDEFQQYSCFYLPELLDREAFQFSCQDIVPDWQTKSRAFNFMINKSRPHRQMLLKLIDEHSLSNFSHSLCWETSTVSSVPTTNYRIGNEIQLTRGIKNGSYTNSLTYKVCLQSRVFESSCISLITEPAYTEKQTIVTEKTIMALYGGTIPIWVGGWRIADYMQSQGFDIFSDVVDHSYQSLNDPAQRVQQAIELNIGLLQKADPDFLSKYLNRLQHNYNLIKSNPFEIQCKTIRDSLKI